MVARIFRPSKSSMQSGRAATRQWVLEYAPSAPKMADPLMGWTGSTDMKADQLRLTFDTREEAIAYAESQGIAYEVRDSRARKIVPKSYADNFPWHRPA